MTPHKTLVAEEVLRATLLQDLSTSSDAEHLQVKSIDGLNFYTDLYLGTEYDKVKMAVSTQTPVTFVASAAGECSGCNEHQKGYDYHKSSSISKTSSAMQTVSLGKDSISGVMVQDQLSLHRDEANETSWGEIEMFPFMIANEWN
mmetsp:Transcript_22617/g.34910  ORF Transcript_22617/g.34910 Transcript_22617/m.34910 type:complete len:145 (-) Transcript_22617:213-647(-)